MKRKIFFGSSFTEIFRSLFYGGEPESLAAFLFLLRKTDVVWDIGASIGLYSVYTSDRVNQVVAFEPEPDIFGKLGENINLNNCNNVTLKQCGLGAQAGEIQLNTDGIDGLSPSVMNLGRHANSTSVPIYTIDSVIKDGVPRPTVLKIDIEGMEYDCLQGAKELLGGNHSPRMIFIEVHPDFLLSQKLSDQMVVDLLENAGYHLHKGDYRDDQYHIIAFKN